MNKVLNIRPSQVVKNRMDNKSKVFADGTDKQATFSIGVASRMSGLSPHTIRIWERRYKILLTKRTDGGQRAFTLIDIDHLKLLKALTEKGFRIGELSKMPMNELLSLCQDSGVEGQIRRIYRMQVLDFSNLILCQELVKQFPQCVFGSVNDDTKALLSDWMESHSSDMLANLFQPSRRECFDDSKASSTTELASPNKPVLSDREYFDPIDDAILVSMAAVHLSSLDAIKTLKSNFSGLLIAAHYIHPKVKQALAGSGVYFFQSDNTSSLSDAIGEWVSRRVASAGVIDIAKASNVTLPFYHPKLFSKQALEDIANKPHLLDCECPPHIVELIQKLSAFEEYSKECRVENENQAIIHACIYAYTAQARHLMEKSLMAVSNEA